MFRKALKTVLPGTYKHITWNWYAEDRLNNLADKLRAMPQIGEVLVEESKIVKPPFMTVACDKLCDEMDLDVRLCVEAEIQVKRHSGIDCYPERFEIIFELTVDDGTPHYVKTHTIYRLTSRTFLSELSKFIGECQRDYGRKNA